MSEAIVIVLLTVHLLAVNVACAGPLLAVWLGCAADSEGLRSQLGRSVAWRSVWGMIVGMLTGGLIYLVGSPGMLAALKRVPTRGLWFAAVELAFSLTCLLLFAGCWNLLRRHRWWRASLALLSSSNLLYHFPPLMSILGKLGADPNWSKAEVLDRPTLLHLMGRGEILALSSHFALASLAVSAVLVLWLLGKSKQDPEQAQALLLIRRTAWIALGSTALQVPVGIWLLITVPRSTQSAMMGNSPMASLAFLGSLLLTFLLLQQLLRIAIGQIEPRKLFQVAWLLAALVLLMATTLITSRVKSNVLVDKRSHSENSRGTSSSTAAGSSTSRCECLTC